MRPTLILLAALALALPARADDPQPARDPLPDGGTPIFDGKTLDGWDGDPKRWRVQDGVIRGETSADAPLPDNTFLIWRKGQLYDFELTLSVRVSKGGDSGIQYRAHEARKWRLGGYQSDVRMEGNAGLLFHELGRAWLANPGEFIVMEDVPRRRKVGLTADADVIAAKKHTTGHGEWHRVRVACRGNHHVHEVNGHEVIEFIDNDPRGRVLTGLLGLQLHTGPPMWVEYRDIRLRAISGAWSMAMLFYDGRELKMGAIGPAPFAHRDGFLHTVPGATGALHCERRMEGGLVRLTLKVPEREAGDEPAELLLCAHGDDDPLANAVVVQLGAGRTGYVTTRGDYGTRGAAAKAKVHPRRGPAPAPGDWVTVEAELVRGHLRVRIGGKLVNEIDGFDRRPGRVALRGGAPITIMTGSIVPAQ